MSRRKQTSGTGRIFARFGYVFMVCVVVYSAWVGLRSFGASYTPDRMNVVIYDEVPVLVFLGLSDKVNYVITFSHDDKVYVPGGYGRYRVGALGKLAHLQKDEDLVSRAFSSMISARVDHSIAPRSDAIYDDSKSAEPDFTALTIARHIFSGEYSFDGGLWDKVKLIYQLASHRSSDFIQLKGTFKEDPDGDIIFSEKRFQKKYRGFFYQQALRDEAKSVQIEYGTYTAGSVLSRIIEGQGIRVVDLSLADITDTCTVTHQGTQAPITAVYLGSKFGCHVQAGKVEGADIVVRLSNAMDAKWK